MTTTAVATPQTFEQKVFERMRESIGQLMTDEDLKKLLDTTVERMFFTEKVIEGRYYSDRRTEPPEIFKLVRELVEPQLRKALAAHLEAHADDVRKAIGEAIAGGFTAALARSFDAMMAEPMMDLQTQLFKVISANNLRSE